MRSTLPKIRKLVLEQALSNQDRAIMLDVTRHVFTLRADMARLRRFVDSYLNFVDDDMPPPFYFQPAAPFVTFELLYYPYLAVASRNLSAFPQREMSFSIPLECYAIEDGVLVFKQYAVCIPFLYVDEALSIVSGRELFGLPKVAVRFETLVDQVRPDAPSQIGRLSLRVPGPNGDEYAPFIEVYREPSRYASFRQTPGNLLNAVPDAIGGYTSFAADAWEALTKPPFRGYDNQRDVQSMLGMIRANAEMLYGAFPMLQFMRPAPGYSVSSADEQLGPMSIDLISLKQVRDAELPDYVSFQALVRSTMYVDRINDGGFLFGPLGDDPTSEVSIKINHLASQPLVESLGLLTEETSSGGGAGRSVGAGGKPTDAPESRQLISTLKPVLPGWLNMDLVYGLGTNLYWRGRQTDWSSTDYPGPRAIANDYITHGGGALQENPSRVVSPYCLIWVLQLRLDPDGGEQRLNRLVTNTLDSDCYEFRLAPDFLQVWLFIREMDNSGEGRGLDAEQEVEFAAVVEWFEKKNGRAVGPPLGKALMPIYVLTDNQTAVFTESEVYGRPTVRAKIKFNSASWTSGTVDSVMNVDTLILPELYAGGAPAPRTLVQVSANLKGSLGKPSDKERKVLQFPTVALKQVVDCRLPDRVDFQAIVFRLLELRWAKEEQTAALSASTQSGPTLITASDWSVAISRYRSLPLVQKMGVKVKNRSAGEYTTVETIELDNVWAFPGTVEELGSLNLAWRIGNSPWMSHVDPLAELRRIAPRMQTAMALSNLVVFLDGVSVFRSTGGHAVERPDAEEPDDVY